MSTGELSDDGHSVVEIGETDMTAWLEVGGSIVTSDAETGSFAPNAGTGANAALIESSAASCTAGRRGGRRSGHRLGVCIVCEERECAHMSGRHR